MTEQRTEGNNRILEAMKSHGEGFKIDAGVGAAAEESTSSLLRVYCDLWTFGWGWLYFTNPSGNESAESIS